MKPFKTKKLNYSQPTIKRLYQVQMTGLIVIFGLLVAVLFILLLGK